MRDIQNDLNHFFAKVAIPKGLKIREVLKFSMLKSRKFFKPGRC